MTNEIRTVLLLSGGLDSAVLLWDVTQPDSGCNVHAVHYDYGQRNLMERKCALEFARMRGVTCSVVQLGRVFSGSLLTGDGEGCVVPNRNQVFLSIQGAFMHDRAL